jgi:hypothetical protein
MISFQLRWEASPLPICCTLLYSTPVDTTVYGGSRVELRSNPGVPLLHKTWPLPLPPSCSLWKSDFVLSVCTCHTHQTLSLREQFNHIKNTLRVSFSFHWAQDRSHLLHDPCANETDWLQWRLDFTLLTKPVALFLLLCLRQEALTVY